MEQVYTIEQYKDLPIKQRVSLDEYEVEFYDLDDNGFWYFAMILVYSEGKAAQSKIEKWVKSNYPIAEQISITHIVCR